MDDYNDEHDAALRSIGEKHSARRTVESLTKERDDLTKQNADLLLALQQARTALKYFVTFVDQQRMGGKTPYDVCKEALAVIDSPTAEKAVVRSTVYDCDCGLIYRDQGRCRKCGTVFGHVIERPTAADAGGLSVESIAANHDAMIILTQGYPREAVIRVVDAHTSRQVAAARPTAVMADGLDFDGEMLKKITDAYVTRFPIPCGYACNEVVGEVVALIERAAPRPAAMGAGSLSDDPLVCDIFKLKRSKRFNVRLEKIDGAADLTDAEIDQIAEQRDLHSIQDGGKVSRDTLRDFARDLMAARPTASGAVGLNGPLYSTRQDAARWREVVMHVGASPQRPKWDIRFHLAHLDPIKGADLFKGSVAQHFTEAIDAARAKRDLKGGA